MSKIEELDSNLNTLSVRNDFDAILEPLDVSVLFIELDLELNVVVLNDVLASQLRGELVRILCNALSPISDSFKIQFLFERQHILFAKREPKILTK